MLESKATCNEGLKPTVEMAMKKTWAVTLKLREDREAFLKDNKEFFVADYKSAVYRFVPISDRPEHWLCYFSHYFQYHCTQPIEVSIIIIDSDIDSLPMATLPKKFKEESI